MRLPDLLRQLCVRQAGLPPVGRAPAGYRGGRGGRPLQGEAVAGVCKTPNSKGVRMARLLSINVGRPRDIAWRGKIVYTSVWKKPVEGRRLVRRLNVDGDAQGDLHGHGGEQRAETVRMPVPSGPTREGALRPANSTCKGPRGLGDLRDGSKSSRSGVLNPPQRLPLADRRRVGQLPHPGRLPRRSGRLPRRRADPLGRRAARSGRRR
jgi:hypothetical protein